VAVAERLARLAAHYGFDEWLLNIEGQRRPARDGAGGAGVDRSVTPSCTQLIGSQAVML
jgi:hypothetical protein